MSMASGLAKRESKQDEMFSFGRIAYCVVDGWSNQLVQMNALTLSQDPRSTSSLSRNALRRRPSAEHLKQLELHESKPKPSSSIFTIGFVL